MINRRSVPALHRACLHLQHQPATKNPDGNLRPVSLKTDMTALQGCVRMSPQFGVGTLVNYAGARWRVQRAPVVEAVLLRSDTRMEVSADPLKIRLLRSR